MEDNPTLWRPRRVWRYERGNQMP